MKCPACGGKPQHLVTTKNGKLLLQCRTGLTVMRQPSRDDPKRIVTGIVTCDTVCDNRGSKVSGKYVYMTEGEPEALTVRDGRIIL